MIPSTHMPLFSYDDAIGVLAAINLLPLPLMPWPPSVLYRRQTRMPRICMGRDTSHALKAQMAAIGIILTAQPSRSFQIRLRFGISAEFTQLKLLNSSKSLREAFTDKIRLCLHCSAGLSD
ncbi:hypothetical protein BDQ12DRAFT_321886 [Crucibulum laeve]|uniref:Uncharacterized protein n=1 Tax=Crucibulum laeve TaxID=68775 RepID=A0A5C3LQP4_9AGAR|nr:hypothetical protein BDQ12DRAFT_321886 [Crucibulum laeve]